MKNTSWLTPFFYILGLVIGIISLYFFGTDSFESLRIYIQFTATYLGAGGLLLAFLNFRRKSNVAISATYTTSGYYLSDDFYISSITLKNLKDKSEIIFAIYLHDKTHGYIELRKFEESPLILKGYEIHNLFFEKPVSFYLKKTKNIRLQYRTNFFDSRFTLVLSTSLGEYKVKSWLNIWNPREQIIPAYIEESGIPIVGNKAKYIIQLEGGSGSKKIDILDKKAYFTGYCDINFDFNDNDLESVETLKIFLQQQKKTNPKAFFGYTSFKVIDAANIYNDYVYRHCKDKCVVIGPYSKNS